MVVMLLKMSALSALYVGLTALIWWWLKQRQLKLGLKIAVGVLYGLFSVLSTHYGVDYGNMMMNVRDIGPLAAGLFFSPLSGVLAGLIGGVERYIAGTYWGVGSYTRIACSVSTCLAGFLAALLKNVVFKQKKPSALLALFLGAVMEVFHMYVVLITHRSDMSMAFYVVRVCSGPMIGFTAVGLAGCSIALQALSGELRNPFRRLRDEDIPISRKFHMWLFGVSMGVLTLNFIFSFMIQTESARQEAKNTMLRTSEEVGEICRDMLEMNEKPNVETYTQMLDVFHLGSGGTLDLVQSGGMVWVGDHGGKTLSMPVSSITANPSEDGFYVEKLFDERVMFRLDSVGKGYLLLTALPTSEVYANRDEHAYEAALADILLITVIYSLISMLVQKIVVYNLDLVNGSLGKITRGDLNEVVAVRSSSEFASLSDDINQTVDALKGYIAAAEKRIEEELEFARTIQDSALPKNFRFPRSDFELYATMDPAKEVGGDFYDFFFVDQDRLALVIADVSGKGIPAALFMMRGKTAIRNMAQSGNSPAEILYRANNTLCEGNDAEMFVTVWLGIIDLKTGHMICANAGHEYPALMRAREDYALFKDRHGLALAAMEEVRFKEYTLDFNPGDKLFVYTDGVPEAIDENVEQYGGERLIRVLNATKRQPMEQVLPAVRQDIQDFVGDADQFDDITMLGFTWFGPCEGRNDREGNDDRSQD
ncbi:MAG: SpoIIE family protein phosphatase [Clostridia bacterium]|nr:SpoIIE family protein phosphatase [Clostridia bacterium]